MTYQEFEEKIRLYTLRDEDSTEARLKVRK